MDIEPNGQFIENIIEVFNSVESKSEDEANNNIINHKNKLELTRY